MLEIWERPDGVKMRVHPARTCKGRSCVVHAPSNHHMRGWFLHWRTDRGIFERICSHGIGHPDPDQFEFWSLTGQDAQAVHGCDGCCHRGRLRENATSTIEKEPAMPSLDTRLNDLLDKLTDDGCFDHAQILFQILEDNDLLREEDYILPESDSPDVDQER